MRFCFVSTRRGSYFMTELLGAVSTATAAAGHDVELALDAFPPLADELVYVFIPHEFHTWGDPQGFPDAEQRARTLALCTENPGTPWFEDTFRLLPELAGAVSINRSSAAELRRRGISCEHIQLGYSPLWDTWHGARTVSREIEVLYLGAADPRRDPLLAGMGARMWRRQCQLLVPPLEPRTRARPDFLTETDKYHRLRSAKVLLNLHRTTSAALEWMRFLEAIANGCVVVSEPCLDNEPLIPGEHFIAATASEIPAAIDRLLDEPHALDELREHAYNFIRSELPMERAGERLVEVATELPRRSRPGGTQSVWEPASTIGAHNQAIQPAAHASEAATQEPRSGGVEGAPAHERRLPNTVLAMARRARRLGGRRTALRPLTQTSAHRQARPAISIISMAAGVDAHTIDRLASIAVHRGDCEALLSLPPEGDAAQIQHLLNAHPDLAAAVYEQPLDGGLARSRNALIARARGSFIFVLAEHGGVYPSALTRLRSALDADPQALFSYPMIALYDGEDAVGLRGSLPWEPERLIREDWIDGMALFRREPLMRLGGYSPDPSTTGWEDLDLWCRCAEDGGHGVQVPQVLGWRLANARPGESQPAAIPTDLVALLRERHPRLFAAAS